MNTLQIVGLFMIAVLTVPIAIIGIAAAVVVIVAESSKIAEEQEDDNGDGDQ